MNSNTHDINAKIMNNYNYGKNRIKIIVDSFNLFQFFGWLLCLNLFLLHVLLKYALRRDDESTNNILSMSITVLKITQTIQIFEVVLAALKLGGSSVLTTSVQILSRLLVIYIFLYKDTPLINLVLFLIPWCIADSTRALFYVQKDTKLLGLLRYNLFIVMYPVGVTGEVLLIEKSLIQNKLLDYYYFIRLYQITTVVGLVFLYTYLLQQRKKFYKKLKEDEIKTK